MAANSAALGVSLERSCPHRPSAAPLAPDGRCLRCTLALHMQTAHALHSNLEQHTGGFPTLAHIRDHLP